ncbi:sensor histidine kinase [Mucilaginibacter pedocola]|uniref:Signal transduction histidine kinase internal region domain-containing protein n=1 Tax=Mucilaginibacter pedocola TaxID=1792845 RepID=A0A1S9P8Z3_9SPHI|nr:histidine kinase [Mucilaginibacter pedocola]OOQ57307.1 hypothetical protein BC343_14420 [Mucilaginibacter pedocola]
MAVSGIKKLLFSAQFYIIVGLIALTLFPLAWPIKLPPEFWAKQVLVNLMWAALFYLNLLFLAPNFLYKNRVLPFLLLLIAVVVGVVYLNNWLDEVTGVRKALIKLFNKKSDESNKHDNYWTIISALIVLGISSIIAISKKIRLDQEAIRATEKDKITNELSFLKSQINPHFFFNILHTIYALADSNVAGAKDAIYTLSHMMRYVIYETKNDLTNLEKEIKFIEDYIKLMKLRLSDDVQIIFEKPEHLRNHDIAPMIFLPFVENAFKHGISSVHPSYIFIEISQTANTLILEIKNSLFNEKAQYLEESNGIGVANTKRRLDLLYPGRYSLDINSDAVTKDYTVSLTLNLK